MVENPNIRDLFALPANYRWKRWTLMFLLALVFLGIVSHFDPNHPWALTSTWIGGAIFQRIYDAVLGENDG